MSEFLSRFQPIEVVILGGVIVFAFIALTALRAWRTVRLAQAESALRQALASRGFSAAELERLFQVPPEPEEPSPEEIPLAEVSQYLSAASVEGKEMAEVMSRIHAADAATTQAVLSALRGINEAEGDKEQMLGAIDGLCGAKRQSRELEVEV